MFHYDFWNLWNSNSSNDNWTFTWIALKGAIMENKFEPPMNRNMVISAIALLIGAGVMVFTFYMAITGVMG